MTFFPPIPAPMTAMFTVAVKTPPLERLSAWAQQVPSVEYSCTLRPSSFSDSCEISASTEELSNSDRLLDNGATGSSYFVCLAEGSLFKLVVYSLMGKFWSRARPDMRSGMASFAYSTVADSL